MIALLNQPWAERLGWTLLHFLWQGAAIAALYALVRSRIAARYAVACIALAAMAIAPAATYLWLGNSGTAISAATGSTPAGAIPAAPAAPHSSIQDASQQALPWIVMVWFAGVAACSIRLAGGWLSAAALRTSQNRPAPPEWQQTLDRLIARIRVTRPVRLLISDKVESPSVVGWLRPVILAPVSALSGLAPEHLEALLAHELAHIRRHDYLVNVLQGIVESLLFYHPAVWWVSHQVRIEREHCCDDLAVAVSGDVLIYARALAHLESARPAHFKAALAANDGSLVRRIRRLVDPAPPTGSGAAWLLSILTLLVIGGVALSSAQSAPADTKPFVVVRSTIWPDTVKQGDMALEVRGLGRILSNQEAAIRIAESQVADLKPGQLAVIDVERGKGLIPGKLASIQPDAVNGTVGIMVQLDAPLPPGITPQAQVDAVISIGMLHNVVYVGRPVFGQANTAVMLYKIEPDGKSAFPVKVQFGASSVNKIEIKSGLQPGDQVILSDMSKYGDLLPRIELR